MKTNNTKRRCKVCKCDIFGDNTWNMHINGKKHNFLIRSLQLKKLKKYQKKKKKNDVDDEYKLLLLSKNNGIKNGTLTEYKLDPNKSKIQIMPTITNKHITFFECNDKNDIKSVSFSGCKQTNDYNIDKIMDINLNKIKMKYNHQYYSIENGFPSMLKSNVIETIYDFGQKLKELNTSNIDLIIHINTLMDMFRMRFDNEYGDIVIGIIKGKDMITLEQISSQRFLNKKNIQVLIAKHVISHNKNDNDIVIDIGNIHNIGNTKVFELRQLICNKLKVLCVNNMINNVDIFAFCWHKQKKTAKEIINELPMKVMMKYWLIMFFNDLDKAIFVIINSKDGNINYTVTIKRKDIEIKYANIILKFKDYITNIFEWISEIKSHLKNNVFYVLKPRKDKASLISKSVKLALYEMSPLSIKTKIHHLLYDKAQRIVTFKQKL